MESIPVKHGRWKGACGEEDGKDAAQQSLRPAVPLHAPQDVSRVLYAVQELPVNILYLACWE